nr:hypothetical protein Iba_chr04fCG10450 [Ipomoea batatas]
MRPTKLEDAWRTLTAIPHRRRGAQAVTIGPDRMTSPCSSTFTPICTSPVPPPSIIPGSEVRTIRLPRVRHRLWRHGRSSGRWGMSTGRGRLTFRTLLLRCFSFPFICFVYVCNWFALFLKISQNTVLVTATH